MSLDIRYSITRGADLDRITALVVSANCGRQGIGRQLLREAEAIARRAHGRAIEVTSNIRREIAHAFYLGCATARAPAISSSYWATEHRRTGKRSMQCPKCDSRDDAVAYQVRPCIAARSVPACGSNPSTMSS
jgi:hypothetical protein